MASPALQPQAAPSVWDEVGSGPGSWYLDPEAASQKRRVHVALLPPDAAPARLALKTDCFEEAFGSDSPLADLLPRARRWLLMDRASPTLRRARKRHPAATCLTTDVRHLALRSAAVDLIFSNSTLDHFEHRADFEAALAELARVTAAGGRLILTVDNPLNPLYWPLRWLCTLRWAPFPLGYSPAPRRLRRQLANAGFEIQSTVFLIHNPRLISTILFLGMRRLLGDRAGAPIRALLAVFQWLDRLPTRRITACYHGVVAVRR